MEEVEAIEAQAGQIDPDDKAALYELLIVAYFKVKDALVASQEMAPEPVIKIDTDEIDRLTSELHAANTAGKAIGETNKELLDANIKLVSKIDAVKGLLAED